MKEGKKNSKSEVKKESKPEGKKKWFHVSLPSGTRIQVEIKIYTKYIDERGEKKLKIGKKNDNICY